MIQIININYFLVLNDVSIHFLKTNRKSQRSYFKKNFLTIDTIHFVYASPARIVSKIQYFVFYFPFFNVVVCENINEQKRFVIFFPYLQYYVSLFCKCLFIAKQPERTFRNCVLVLCLYVMILTILFIQYIYNSGFCKFLNELFGRLHHIFCLQ